MSKTNKKNYVLFKLCENFQSYTFEWVPYYYTREQLVNKIALGEMYKSYESIIDNMSADMHERVCAFTTQKVRHTDWFIDKPVWYREYIHKYYICKISGNAIKSVSIKSLMIDVNNTIMKRTKKNAKRAERYNKRKQTRQYTFRKGPVPLTGCRGWRHHSYYRQPQLQNVRRENSDYEYREFVKPKYKKENLPTWDDRPRHNDKSWKTSCKVRKQWQKHVRKHVDTSYYDKKAYDMEYETED